jgi:hypothetical protein
MIYVIVFIVYAVLSPQRCEYFVEGQAAAPAHIHHLEPAHWVRGEEGVNTYTA